MKHDPTSLPLPTLLSQVLVAFTIEFDNEFEHLTPHWITNQASTSREGAWLASMVMWSNCMQFVGEDGISVGELENLARTKTNLNGMIRWGYIVAEPPAVEPTPGDRRAKLSGRSAGLPRPDWLIRATRKGQMAQKVWRPLFNTIETRWEARFGKHEIEQLRESLSGLVGQIGDSLPDCLPILGYGLFSRGPDQDRKARTGTPTEPRAHIDPYRPLSALLSKVLLKFAIEFERESELSLAISANVVRVLAETGVDEKGVRVRDLPLLSGVSKEAIHMALGVLQKKRIVVIAPGENGKAKLARLTTTGREAQDAYRGLIDVIEERWGARFGGETVRRLRELLERLVGDAGAQSPLFLGLAPYPDGWRAAVRKPDTLPHYPMVLHRGGYPDGS